MNLDLDIVRSTLQSPLMERIGWREALHAEVGQVFSRAQHGIRLDHHICRPKILRTPGKEVVGPVPSLDVALKNVEATSAEYMRLVCARPPELTYAQLQGRLCAEEGFFDATEELHERSGLLTFDDHLRAWGDLVDLIVREADTGPAMVMFSIPERHHWAAEAIGTVIDRARLFLLGPPGRAHPASLLHHHIGVIRLFLMSREYREANSFDALLAVPTPTRH